MSTPTTTPRLLRQTQRLALLIPLVVIVLSGLAILRVLKEKERHEAARLHAIVELQARHVADWLHERQGDAEMVRVSPNPLEGYRLWSNQSDLGAATQIQAWLSPLLAKGGFHAIDLYDPEGRLIWSSAEGRHDAASELAQALPIANHTKSTQRVGPYLDSHGQIHLDYVVPLGLDQAAMSPLVVLHTGAEDWLCPRLRAWPRLSLSDSGESFLFRRDGEQVLYLCPLRHLPDAAMRLRLPVSSARLLAAQLLRHEVREGDTLKGVDYRGVPVLGVASSIAGTDWMVVAKLDRAEIRASAVQEIALIGLVGGLLLVTLTAGTLVLRHRQRLALATATQEAQTERLRALGLLAALADSSEDLIYTKDLQGRYTLINRATARYLGRTPEAALGCSDYDLLSPETAESCIAGDHQAIANDAPILIEEQVSLAEGPCTLMTTKGPLRDASGQVIGVFGIGRDVSARRAMQNDLRASERRFLATFEQAAVGIALVAPDGRWLRVNRRLCEMLGYAETDLFGKTFQDITYPADLDSDLELVGRVLAGEIATYSLEKRYIRRDGDPMWINLTVSLVRQDDGAPDYFISVIEDISERKSAESRLKLWNDAFEKAELNLAMSDAVHQWLLAVNPAFARRRGYRPEEMVGMPIGSLFPADRWDAVQAQVREADAKGHHVFEAEHLRRDGERFPVLLDVTVTYSEDGRPTRRIVHALDMSARLAAEAARRASEARLREAQRIAGLGHWEWDLRLDRHAWSEEIYQIYGRDPALSPARYPEVMQYFTPESWADLTRAVDEALSEGTAYQCDAEVRRPDGSHRWITARGEAVRDATGEPILLRGTVQDITARKEAEQALRESEERFRAVFDQQFQFMAILTPEGRTIDINALVLHVQGYAREDFIGHLFWESPAWRDYPEWQHIWPERLAQAAACAGPVLTQDVYQMRDGQVRMADAATTAIRGSDGTVRWYVIQATDTTERCRAEAARRESEERLRLFIEHAPASLAMFDREMRYLAVSRRWLEDYGLLDGDVLGRCHYAVFPEIGESWKTVHRRGLAGEVMSADEERFDRADGQVQWLRWEMLPWNGADGGIGGIIIFTEDITARKEGELKLRATRQRFQDIVDASADWVWEVDIQGRYTYVSDGVKAVLGYSPAEILGRSAFELMPTEEGRRVAAEFSNIVARRMSFRDLENINLHRDGRLLYIHTTGVPILEADGKLLGYRGLDRDVTERRLAEQELDRYRHQLEDLVTARTAELMAARAEAERLARAKGEFLANMSHEIRTPMNAVLGLAYLLERQDLSEGARELARKIHQSGRSLLGIINDILDFSKIESGHLEIEHVSFRLDEVLDNLAIVMTTTAADKSLELVIKPPDCLDTTLLGDALRLGQILINLTSNAIKFTASGVVEVAIETLECDESRIHLRFSVRDTGMGIDAATQARLFQPFAQADASTTRRFGGSGLGLAISRRLVELMGGRLGIESRLGEGSTFWFELPFDLAKAASVHRDRRTQVRVLIADDNPSARAGVAATAAALGWPSCQVDSGRQALRRVLRDESFQGPDAVVLLNSRMPGLDGLASALAIRQALPASVWPLLFLLVTHRHEEQPATSAVPAVDAVLIKPLTPSSLHDAVIKVREQRLGDRSLSPLTTPSERRLAGLRLLVVDDSDINREVAERIFAGEGALIHLANDGQEALDWLLAHPGAVDLVLMDVQMPVLDGRAATRLIRQTPGIATIPIVALTADALRDQEAAALEAGMDAFLSKPFDVPEAIALIRALTHGPAQARAAISTQGPSVETVDPPVVPMPADADEALPGIALDRGLAIWKDDDVYRQYLRRFARSYADSADTIAKAEPGFGQQLAHKLKGTAGNLALIEVANEAGELERALAAGLAISVKPLRRALDRALTSIICYAPETFAEEPGLASQLEPPSARISVALVAPLLREILGVFERFDPMAAEPALDSLATHLSAAQLAPLRQAVEEFDATAGVAALHDLADALTIQMED
ncbi:PAS domain S-box protein [Thiocystis violascens]|uniref:Sensory/regulatory protein RpfC n=1 Tax=Thiocystis violascens (strain ATCC 17096 / DSM 198 / 6111) TaxID=765911 RepID=I3Y9M6_THIV6|nr:PAS domain S-box protein [Thiocystis violascens]AFL73694.1 PAS domain S-box [Thiocystis violascens DSM 198]